MTKVDENIKSAQNLLSGIVERCHELEEENKGLREILKSNGQMVTMRESTIYRLEEENYKLEEENIKLKSDLEQFSEAYKRYRDYEKEELAESCFDLERENKKLKEEVKDLVERNVELDKKYMIILTENKNLKEELKERNKLIRDIVLNFHRIDENKILELLLKIPTE